MEAPGVKIGVLVDNERAIIRCWCGKGRRGSPTSSLRARRWVIDFAPDGHTRLYDMGHGKHSAKPEVLSHHLAPSVFGGFPVPTIL